MFGLGNKKPAEAPAADGSKSAQPAPQGEGDKEDPAAALMREMSNAAKKK